METKAYFELYTWDDTTKSLIGRIGSWNDKNMEFVGTERIELFCNNEQYQKLMQKIDNGQVESGSTMLVTYHNLKLKGKGWDDIDSATLKDVHIWDVFDNVV